MPKGKSARQTVPPPRSTRGQPPKAARVSGAREPERPNQHLNKRPVTKRVRRVIAASGHHGAIVSIVPRDGHPSQAQAQWLHPKTRARQRRTIQGISLNPDHLPRELRSRLQNLAGTLHRRLVNRQAMPGEPGAPTWEELLAEASPTQTDDIDAAAGHVITVREALEVAYGRSYADQLNQKQTRISSRFARSIKGKPSNAAAVSTWTEHARELRRLADVVERVLGPNEPWSWSDTTYERLRDTLIDEVRASGPGMRAAKRFRVIHKVLQVYIRATRLVQKKSAGRAGLSAIPKALVMERWLVDLKEAWRGAGILVPHEMQPRYDIGDAAKIYAEATSGNHDPRYGLWIELGMEGRPVQILRARRSFLRDTHPGTPAGLFQGMGAGLKKGLVYAPTPAHRLKINRYLNGYLRELEAQYVHGDPTTDYPLFPAGSLVNGVIPWTGHMPTPLPYRQFIGDAAAGTGYYAIERAAGVKHEVNRGAYGLKYTVADVVPMVAGKLGIADAAAINLATGHDTPGTATQYRKNVREQPAVLYSVGRLIWGVRGHLRQASRMQWPTGLTIAEEQRIADYRVDSAGVLLRLDSGDRVWVPWTALRLAGENAAIVDLLGEVDERRGPDEVEIDEDAQELRFYEGRVILRASTMYMRALENDSEKNPEDATLLKTTATS
jgi:hypothetical protein